MKAELITNVSHDLKTPLTAIITYVDLLKDEANTIEQQKHYIEIIEKKAERLKGLIEDLFEMSKASSNSVELQKEDIDIISLIKQVELELQDRMCSAGIEVRMNLPEEKVTLNLDSQKTYRIFDNLFVNISKYALMNTRAYVDYEENENGIIITLKNISSSELNYKGDEIVERFIRGDESRHTEGTGLGLAIVKSFMEIQNGSLEVIIDGDLFKVILTFRKSDF